MGETSPKRCSSGRCAVHRRQPPFTPETGAGGQVRRIAGWIALRQGPEGRFGPHCRRGVVQDGREAGRCGAGQSLIQSNRSGAKPRRTMKRALRNAVYPCLLALAAATASAQTANYRIEGDGIPQSLTGKPGSAERGRALLAKADKANCLTCHAIKGMPGGGTKGPSLDGVGAALTPAQLRLSVVDLSRVTRGTAMPGFHTSAGLAGGGPRLSAEEVEDVVAYLMTLKK